MVADLNNDEYPEHVARQQAVVEIVAETSAIPEAAAEEVVDHAKELKLIADVDDEPLVYIPRMGPKPGEENE